LKIVLVGCSIFTTNRQGAEVECFFEGPSFDREGNFWIVDIPFGHLFHSSPQKALNLVVQYDGWPNGLKFHKDGRVFIADYKKGLLALDPQTARPSTSPKRCPVIF
jgi:gluconolactonase